MPFTLSNKSFIFTRGQRTGTKMPVTPLRRNIPGSTAYRHQIAGKKKTVGISSAEEASPLYAVTPAAPLKFARLQKYKYKNRNIRHTRFYICQKEISNNVNSRLLMIISLYANTP